MIENPSSPTADFSANSPSPEPFLSAADVLNAGGAAFVATDTQGRIRHWSAGAERLFGVPAGEALDQPLLRYLRADLFSENFGFLETAELGGDIPAQSVLCQNASGEPLWLVASARTRRDDAGNRLGLLLTLMPHPPRTETTPATELSGKGSRSFGIKRIVSYLSHEVRIPLAAILGFAEMMYDAKQTVSERMSCISRIRNNVKHLTDLMDDISDLTLIESGELRLKSVTFSLLPELGEVFSMLQTHAWKKRLELRVSFEGPIPETVTLDASRLRQVLFNIVGEMIEEASRGTMTIRIEMKKDEQEEMKLVFHISGPNRSGGSIEESRFEPFPCRDDRSGFLFGGHRLGLALARRLARLLGGDVIAHTGQNFYQTPQFTIQVKAGSARGVKLVKQVTEADLRVRESSLFNTTTCPLDGMNVLLVEDSPDIQILIRHFLKKFGANVQLAETGEEGLSKAKAQTFDVVLMDLQLPILNGFEATQELRKLGYRAPIIALTAHALNDVRDKCLQAGFDEYMTKPIHASALIDALQRHYRAGTRH